MNSLPGPRFNSLQLAATEQRPQAVAWGLCFPLSRRIAAPPLRQSYRAGMFHGGWASRYES
jgi:hypothetical protein